MSGMDLWRDGSDLIIFGVSGSLFVHLVGLSLGRVVGRWGSCAFVSFTVSEELSL